MPTSPQSRTVCVNSDDENKAALVWPLWLLLIQIQKMQPCFRLSKSKEDLGVIVILENILVLDIFLLHAINIVFENILWKIHWSKETSSYHQVCSYPSPLRGSISECNQRLQWLITDSYHRPSPPDRDAVDRPGPMQLLNIWRQRRVCVWQKWEFDLHK